MESTSSVAKTYVNSAVSHMDRVTHDIGYDTIEFEWVIRHFPAVMVSQYKLDRRQSDVTVAHDFFLGRTETQPRRKMKWRICVVNEDVTRSSALNWKGEFLSVYLKLQDYCRPPVYPRPKIRAIASFSVTILAADGSIFAKKDCEVDDYGPTLRTKVSNYGLQLFVPLRTIMEPKNNILNKDALTLLIQVKVFKPQSATCVKTSKIRAKDKVADDLSKLLSNEGSDNCGDFTIKCCSDGKTFQVHKCILKARSAVFRRMLEANMKECSTGILEVEEIDSKTMGLLLNFIYGGVLVQEVGCNNYGAWKDVAVHLIYAAEKYEVLELKHMLDKHLVEAATFSNARDLYETAVLYGLENGARQLQLFIDQNLDDIPPKKPVTEQSFLIKLDP